jgi:hypothetical protein
LFGWTHATAAFAQAKALSFRQGGAVSVEDGFCGALRLRERKGAASVGVDK